MNDHEVPKLCSESPPEIVLKVDDPLPPLAKLEYTHWAWVLQQSLVRYPLNISQELVLTTGATIARHEHNSGTRINMGEA